MAVDQFEVTMLNISVASAHHFRRYCVERTRRGGWEAWLEEDATIRWREIYQDWHRVERAVAKMRREVEALVDHGWTLQRVTQ